MSHGINAGWALGIFQDEFLRSKINLRSKFNNPWMNFTAAGTSIGSIKDIDENFNIALTISSGRNKFQSNEIFGDTNTSSLARAPTQITLYKDAQEKICHANASNSSIFTDAH